MSEQRTKRLRFTHIGKAYTIIADSTKYTEALIVNKLKIGHARYWLILQNGTWRFIGDMPLCRHLKTIIVQKIALWHELPTGSEAAVLSGQESVRTGILLNALLCVMAIKKQIP